MPAWPFRSGSYYKKSNTVDAKCWRAWAVLVFVESCSTNTMHAVHRNTLPVNSWTAEPTITDTSCHDWLFHAILMTLRWFTRHLFSPTELAMFTMPVLRFVCFVCCLACFFFCFWLFCLALCFGFRHCDCHPVLCSRSLCWHYGWVHWCPVKAVVSRPNCCN